MDLSGFLVRAKKRTYAGGGDDAGADLPDGARELTYGEPGLLYRDRYYGWDPFAGEEAVLKDGRVVWSMNYYGRCLPDGVLPAQIYGFLVKALAEVAEEAPYRGPEELHDGEWSYTRDACGDIHEFRGAEKILYKGKDVYRLVFHGGDVAWKA
jgi:hypothetical protein